MVATGNDLADARAGNEPNLKYMKTRISEKYTTIPSNNVDQYIQQISDNPLSLNFVVMNRNSITESVQMNAEVVMSGLTPGKSYGIFFALSPKTSAAAWPTSVGTATYDYTVKVNGFTIVQKSYKTSEMEAFKTGLAGTAAQRLSAGTFQSHYGINVASNTATFTFNVTVPRNSATTAAT